jgi:double zinc ribbon protein
MHCPHCRAETREGRRFCARCGSVLANTCSVCGFHNEAEAIFWGGCGVSLTVLSPPSRWFGAPRKCTPRAERILSHRNTLEGARKQVTLPFADLKGSLELLVDRDPEEARRLLDPVLERMMDAANQYEGIVNQVMGDGIMALFGAPVTHEGHPRSRCSLQCAAVIGKDLSLPPPPARQRAA